MKHWKAFVFALLASVSYTVEAVVTDEKLEKPTPLLLAFPLGVCSALLSLILLLCTPQEKIVWPSGAAWSWVVLAALLTFGADWAHFGALHHKAGAVVLCTSYALMPVMATAMKGEMPSTRLVIAWLFGAMALYLSYEEVSST